MTEATMAAVTIMENAPTQSAVVLRGSGQGLRQSRYIVAESARQTHIQTEDPPESDPSAEFEARYLANAVAGRKESEQLTRLFSPKSRKNMTWKQTGINALTTERLPKMLYVPTQRSVKHKDKAAQIYL